MPSLSASTTRRLLFIAGTRPEAIKLAPLILHARETQPFTVQVCATGQHRELFDSVLANFDIRPDFNLELMTPDQKPAEVVSRILSALPPVLERTKPDWVIVQGDTTSAFAGSLAAFYAGVPVAHIEAGLRTHNRNAPWPEEINRHLTSVIATLHFAPTAGARDNLLAEGVRDEAIEVTGNTVIDAVRRIESAIDAAAIPPADSLGLSPNRRLILVTAHRRENLGIRLGEVCLALRKIADAVDDVEIAIVAHNNPNSRDAIRNFVRELPHDRIRVLEPLDYATFIDVLKRSHAVVTDSGGVQEEAPLFGKAVLVLREFTERPEAIESGNARLVGTLAATIADECIRLLTDASYHASMSRAASPFGDGRASERILERLARS